MYEKVKSILKNNYIYLIVFCVFYMIAYCTPLTGDDWLNYGNSSKSIIGILRSTASYYLSWGGRVGSSIVVLFLTRYKWLWDVCSALVVVVMAWCTSKLSNPKHKTMVAISFTLLILLTNMRMITECFLWIAGNITYTFCFAMLLVYIVYVIYKEKKDLKYKKYEYVIFALLNVFMSTFVENIAASIIVTNMLLLGYSWVKNKKIDKFYLTMTIMSIFGLVIQMVSPGTRNRIEIDDAAFAEMNVFEKVLSNMPNFVKFTYILNPIMVLVFVSALNTLVINKEKNNIVKWISIAFLSIIPIITIVANLNTILPFEIDIFKTINTKLAFICNADNIFVILYWIIFTIYSLFAIIRYCNKETKLETLLIYIVGMISVGAMMVTTVWHARAAFATMMTIYIISLKILSEEEYKRYFNMFKYVIIVCFVTLSASYLIIYNSVRLNVIDRNEYIIKEAKAGSKEINYYRVPEKLLVSEFPYNNSYRLAVNSYLGVDSEIVYKECKSIWKHKMFYNKLY